MLDDSSRELYLYTIEMLVATKGPPVLQPASAPFKIMIHIMIHMPVQALGTSDQSSIAIKEVEVEDGMSLTQSNCS